MAKQMRIGTMLTLGYGVVILLMAIIVAVTICASPRSPPASTKSSAALPQHRGGSRHPFQRRDELGEHAGARHISNKEVLKRVEDEMSANNKAISESFDFLKREFHTDEGKKLVGKPAARADYTRQRADTSS